MQYVKHIFSGLWLIATLYMGVLAYKGFNEFCNIWKYTENQRTIQALIINSEPKTYKGMKDSLVQVLMDR